ncbi:MAG TPA: radical SAM protein [Polyangia bacterium]|nr:radical SAM protein [Polyangia bacterium]
MRILLVQPPEGSAFGVSKVFLPEPLGLELVAAALTPDRHELRLIDMRLERWSVLERELRDFRPDAVGVACAFTSEVIRVREIAQVVRAVRPQAFLFLGGHDATRTPTHFGPEHADAIVMGEGEWTAPRLLRAVEGNQRLDDIPGLSVMTDQGPLRNEGTPDYQEMDLLPVPRRDLVERYRMRYFIGFQRPVYSMETTRGCPYTCNFCSVWEMYERTYRGKSPPAVLEDLARCPGDEIFFTDDLFFLDAKRALALADAIRASGIKKRYTAQIRADSVAKHPEIVEAWRSIGLQRTFIGMEATDDEGLAKVEKKAHIDSTEKAIRLLADAGVEIQGSFIVHPDWGREDFQKLAQFVRERPITYASFSILTPLPGTKLHRERLSEITNHDPELMDVFHAVLPTVLPLEDFYREFANLYRATYPVKRWPEMIAGAFDMWKKKDFLHMARVVSSLANLARPRSYWIAHKSADRRARRYGPARPAPIVSETHKRTAAERLLSLQGRKAAPAAAPAN